MLTRRSLIASLAAVGAVAHRPAFAADVWRIITEYPATAMPGEGIAYFAEQVAARAQGTVTVQPGFDAPDGIKSAAMPDAVATGRVQAADAFTGAMAGENPLFQLSSLPFLTKSADDTGRLLQIARPAYERALAARGLTLLYATPWPATGLWSRTAIDTPDALRGLRVRTYDAAGTAVFQAVGAAPVQISFADALPRLRAGDLDAVLSSGDGGAGARLWEILPHFTALDYASPLSLAFCRTDTLAALAPVARDAVTQAAALTEARQFRAIGGRSAENEARMRRNGVAIAAVPPAVRAVLVQAAAPVIAAWRDRAGAEAGTLLARYG